MSAYSEKLRDPRWQKRRLQILERDGWKCRVCGDSESTLAVHHKAYLPNSDPWDYPDDLLVALCEDCHLYETENRKIFEGQLLDITRRALTTNGIKGLAEALLNSYDKKWDKGWTELLAWILSSPDIQEELRSRYDELDRGDNGER